MRPLPISLALLLSASAYAQSGYYGNIALIPSRNGVVGQSVPVLTVPFASVRVYALDGTQPNLYSNATLSAVQTQPVTADAAGHFGFFMQAGTYTAVITTPAGASIGVYPFTVGGTGGSGGGGGISNVVCPTGSGCTATNDGSGTVNLVIQGPVTGFAISSFTGCSGAVEIGATVTNPTCNATYTATPTSAVIANSDGINSPITLTSPYTSQTITGTFTHTTAACNTFTLTANSTQTARQAECWVPRTFAGVGSAGATGATASGTSAVLVGASGTLANGGLGATATGQSFTVTPSNQKIYLLLTGASHILSVNGFVTSFSTTAVAFVNQNGANVPVVLYEAPALLSGTYIVSVVN